MFKAWRLAAGLLLVASATVYAQEPTGEQKAFLDQMRALNWVKGPTTVEVQGNSKLTIPEKYVFLDAANAKKFLELQHNLSDGREVMAAPQNMEWMAYLEFSDEGYVKDNEKIDAPVLLITLQSNTEAGNEERRKRGWNELRLDEWATPHVYKTTTKRLE